MALSRRGHQVAYDLEEGSFGRGQIILRLAAGCGAAAGIYIAFR
jgi:hypothetical protein